MVMDGNEDCKTDEKTPLNCTADEFTCRNNGRCISRHRVNDGFIDCLDSSDENQTGFSCLKTEFSCGDERCIPRLWVGNSIEDCKTGVDEVSRLNKCLEDEFGCLDQSRCLPLKFLCDGVYNCKDKSDEFDLCELPSLLPCFSENIIDLNYQMTTRKLTNFFTKGIKHCSDLVFGFKCFVSTKSSPKKFARISKEKRAIPQSYINDRNSVCVDESDKCYKNNKFVCSRCLDNKTIISKSQICDNVIDCPDLSDECCCEKSDVEPLCNLLFPLNEAEQSTTINLEQVCNGIAENELDEKFCNFETASLVMPSVYQEVNYPIYECSSHHPSLARSQIADLCDGHVGCPLKDDECHPYCFRQKMQKIFNSSPGTFKKKSKLKLIIDQLLNCFPFIRIKNSDFQKLKNKLLNKKSSFFLKKLYLTKNTSILPSRINITLEEAKTFKMSEINLVKAGKLEKGENGISSYNLVMKRKFKNVFNFTKTSDLCNVKRFSCSWKFYCKTKETESIHIKKRCDQVVDCSDASDETSCSSDTHFYCWKGIPKFISRDKFLDGKFDCLDRSDECGEDYISSPFQMIKNVALRYFVWISSSLTIFLNLLVIQGHVRKLKKLRSKSSVKYINLIILIQLAFSDLLMGFVLLVIGIKSLQFSGEYCYNDLSWRSSISCKILGILTVASSQNTITLLVLITSLRLYLIIRPFKSNQLNFKFFLLVCLCTWIICFLWAIVPVLFEEYFIFDLFIEPNPYFKSQSVNLTTLNKIYKRAEIISSSLRNFSLFQKSLPNQMPSFAAKNYHYFTKNITMEAFPYKYVRVKKLLGYYSKSAVCFPNLYTKNPTSHFILSFCLVLYNLTALLFICCSYIYIFCSSKKSSKKMKTTNQTKNVKLGRRISYIILTDIASWLPIIIISFASYIGYTVEGEVSAISVIVLLPINSAINPLIYSRIDTLIKDCFRRSIRQNQTTSSEHTNKTEVTTNK